MGDREGRKHPQSITDYGFRRAAGLIVHGEQLKVEIIDRLKLPAERIAVIPHIVLGDDREQHQIVEDAAQILFFGRIWEYKGLEYLIRAEPLITSKVPAARIVIAGEGEDFRRYRSLMVHPENFVVHNEYITDAKRTELFRRTSIVVLPYVDASQSGVIPLAYTFEKPVVATTVGALPAMVEDGQTGYLVAPRNEQALADAVVRLLKDPERRRRFGANGKRKIDEECGAETVAHQTLAVYRQALHRVPALAKGMSRG
jgi:glycosyltransferase involved in cell wall biosynthesis